MRTKGDASGTIQDGLYHHTFTGRSPKLHKDNVFFNWVLEIVTRAINLFFQSHQFFLDAFFSTLAQKEKMCALATSHKHECHDVSSVSSCTRDFSLRFAFRSHNFQEFPGRVLSFIFRIVYVPYARKISTHYHK